MYQVCLSPIAMLFLSLSLGPDPPDSCVPELVPLLTVNFIFVAVFKFPHSSLTPTLILFSLRLRVSCSDFDVDGLVTQSSPPILLF